MLFHRTLVADRDAVTGEARPAAGRGDAIVARQPHGLVQKLVHLVPVPPVAAIHRGGADPLVLEGDATGVGGEGDVGHAQVKVPARPDDAQ